MSNIYYTQNYCDNQKKVEMAAIAGLMQELRTLAPHPDKPQYKGPLFINTNANCNAAGEQDGMMGMLLLEAMLGTAFTDAISEAISDLSGMECNLDGFDASAAMEAYSAYITDIEQQTRKNAAHGQGTLARMAGKSISNSFNMRSAIAPDMQAFMDDMPKRMQIETGLATHLRRLDQLARPQPQYAPTPRIAA